MYHQSKGRQLISMDGGSSRNLSFTYNSSGIRTSKTVNGVKHTYTLSGTRILCEQWGNSYLEFVYDENGSPHSLYYYNGSVLTKYYYVCGLQGDVLQLRDETGALVCQYFYDAWGRKLGILDANNRTISQSDHIANLNPLRYRGYYYDAETEFYYLNSRYYSPKISRWISPEPNVYNGEFDEGAGLIGYNVYAYCANNPAIYKDETGESITLACVLIFGGMGLLIGGHFAAKASKAQLGYVNGLWVLGGMVLGGGAGALLGWGVGSAATAIGAKLAAGSSGTLGKVMYSSWQTAEKALRSAYNGAKATFNTPWGKRIVDSYSKIVIREAKYGYPSLSKFLQQEINKDVWILKNTSVKSIEWHFYWSSVSNSGGPSGPLLEELARHGIKVIFH